MGEIVYNIHMGMEALQLPNIARVLVFGKSVYYIAIHLISNAVGPELTNLLYQYHHYSSLGFNRTKTTSILCLESQY
jgi:hypothetical protein